MGKRRDGARFKQQMREFDARAAMGRMQAVDDAVARIEATAEPDVITGVMPPSPLAELSELLGVRVVSVECTGWRDGHRVWWSLTFSGASVEAAELASRQLRSPYALNRLAGYWGRAPGASQLVKADCRRALRLLHEAVEDSTTDITHSESES